jgi:predicted SAM-dependent methyltransferase
LAAVTGYGNTQCLFFLTGYYSFKNLISYKRKVKNIIMIKLPGNIKNKCLFTIYNRFHKSKDSFSCPICNYYGPFLSIFPETGMRRNAQCPKCSALERHRLQYLVLSELFEKNNTGKMSLLHFAPEEFFKTMFRNRFNNYITADLYAKNVDRKEDITCLSFSDNSFDFIFASHVLEHIKNDLLALSEIKRVLKPDGIAILPVPIAGIKTVEYPAPNPHESNHVRSPGMDYYDERYKIYFNVVKLYKSSDFNDIYQLYSYEEKNYWPNIGSLKASGPAARQTDIVPVCYKQKIL